VRCPPVDERHLAVFTNPFSATGTTGSSRSRASTWDLRDHRLARGSGRRPPGHGWRQRYEDQNFKFTMPSSRNRRAAA
jgi:hypothetical protein